MAEIRFLDLDDDRDVYEDYDPNEDYDLEGDYRYGVDWPDILRRFS